MTTASNMTTVVPEWETLLPWLRAGTTQRDIAAPALGGPVAATSEADTGPTRRDLADEAARTLLDRGWRSVARSRQIHGARVRVHAGLPPGNCAVGEGDGHLTREAGLLLAVTLADCVPVFVADPAQRAVGLLHAGWRGTAAGVLERGLSAMHRAFGSDPSDLYVHLGPAICGRCYEVGPEVFRALAEALPAAPAPIDLRRVIRRRALAAAVDGGRLTISGECTLCGDGRYFSHRRGDTGRHLGFIGILPAAGATRPEQPGAAGTRGRRPAGTAPEAGL